VPGSRFGCGKKLRWWCCVLRITRSSTLDEFVKSGDANKMRPYIEETKDTVSLPLCVCANLNNVLDLVLKNWTTIRMNVNKITLNRCLMTTWRCESKQLPGI
jgi:hypothetical protein